jgi:hypothetical protein
MSQIFSFKRFGMLFKKHTIENYKSYAMMLFVLVGIMTIVIGLTNYKAFRPMDMKLQISFFIGFFIAAGTIFTSNIFNNLGDKRKTIASLTLPASSFEKFLVGWVYSFVFFQIVFIGIYYAIVCTVIRLGHWPAGTAPILDVFSTEYKFYTVFVAYAFLHGIVIYGAIFFKKMHFIKTAFSLFIILMAIWFANNWILQLMTGQPISHNPPFTGMSFTYNVTAKSSEYANIDVAPYPFNWVLALFTVLGVLFWVAAYYRLKEKKV